MRARRTAALVLAALVAAAACAKKPVSAPAAPGAPKFADFTYPSGPTSLASPAVWEQHRTAWAILQSGDTKAADRQFTTILTTVPGFYPSEAGLGTFNRSPVFMQTYRNTVHSPTGAFQRKRSPSTRAVISTTSSDFEKTSGGRPAVANTPRGPSVSPSCRLS